MKVLFFSLARTIAGRDEEEFALESPVDAEEVWRRLIERHARLSSVRGTSRLSRNEAYADEATRFSNDDVVAVIPPVSGG